MKYLLHLLFLIVIVSFSCSQDNDIATTGTNSSYSSLIVIDDYMYQVSSTSLITFDVTDPSLPLEIDRQIVGFEIESIANFGGVLFIGSGEALHIFEIDELGIPERRSQTNYSEFDEEQTPCDPVVSDGNFAYVTLSTNLVTENSTCNRPVPVNQLRIYDVSDITKPSEVNRIEMQGPKGLSVDKEHLFICDGANGLLVYNKSDIQNLVELYHFKDFEARDAIAKDGLLIVIAKGELRQYDYSDISQMELLSTLDL